MALVNGEVNPLEVFGMRRVNHYPPHFSPVAFDLRVNEKHILDWIYTHSASRFYFGDRYFYNSNGKIEFAKVVAFESAGEASYFALMLDNINVIKHDEW
jgi:hypothetical protein